MVSDPFFHLLEFYIHSDAPLSCRLPARPAPHVEVVGEKQPEQEYIPLVFALAGTLQLSHMHISTHMNVLLHSTPKHHVQRHDSGVLDSATAYSTSPLTHMEGSATRRLVIGDPLPLAFTVRWFPTPALPKTEGKVEWSGMGGHIYASTCSTAWSRSAPAPSCRPSTFSGRCCRGGSGAGASAARRPSGTA
jgi:hypothetical protein